MDNIAHQHTLRATKLIVMSMMLCWSAITSLTAPAVAETVANHQQAIASANPQPHQINLITGQESIPAHEPKTSVLLAHGSEQYWMPDTWPITPGTKLFSERENVYDTTVDPFDQVVKLWFIDDNDEYFSCSGALIDPMVVITAGHCVHDGDLNWYRQFSIVPAYNKRSADIEHSVILNPQPFGTATATSLIAWQYDFEQSDLHEDIALIALDRPVGALTGWFGLGTSNDCETLTGRDYQSAGFPGETSDGGQMVQTTGRFDGCNTEGSVINYPPISHSAGQSGSAFWEPDTEIVRSVHSGGFDLDGDGEYNDLGFAQQIKDYEFERLIDFAEATLADSPHLVPMGAKINGCLLGTCDLDRVIVSAGAHLDDVSFKLFNLSKVDFQGDVEVKWYLSIDAIITADDVLLASQIYTDVNYRSKQGSWLTLSSAPSIPETITPHYPYYIGVVVTSLDQHAQTSPMHAQDLAKIVVLSATPEQSYRLRTTVAVDYTGTIVADWGGLYCNTSCERMYQAGLDMTLVATSEPGYRFGYWGGDCRGTKPECLLTMDRAYDVIAHFNQQSDMISAKTGQGRITIVGMADCNDRFCTTPVTLQEQVTFMATPAAGWHFEQWDGDCNGSEITCTITATRAHHIVGAQFALDDNSEQASLDLVIAGTGRITSADGSLECDHSCNTSYPSGTVVTLTAPTTTDAHFIGWGGACADVEPTADCTVTLDQTQQVIAAFDVDRVTRSPTTAGQVAELYAAILGYAPDQEGLDYWVNKIDSLPEWTIATVAQSFFDQPAVQARYPSTASDDTILTTLYQTLFAQSPDAQGAEYWLTQLQTGAITRDQLILALLNGGWDNQSPDAIAAMQRFGFRVEIALAFAAYQEDHQILYSRLSPADQGYLRDISTRLFDGITTDSASRDDVRAYIALLLSPLHD
jgi:V8-like Glu-specific endopeptidase